MNQTLEVKVSRPSSVFPVSNQILVKYCVCWSTVRWNFMAPASILLLLVVPKGSDLGIAHERPVFVCGREVDVQNYGRPQTVARFDSRFWIRSVALPWHELKSPNPVWCYVEYRGLEIRIVWLLETWLVLVATSTIVCVIWFCDMCLTYSQWLFLSVWKGSTKITSTPSTFEMVGSWGRPTDASDCWRWLMMVFSRRSFSSFIQWLQLWLVHLPASRTPTSEYWGPRKRARGVGWPAMIQVLLFFLLQRRGGCFNSFSTSWFRFNGSKHFHTRTILGKCNRFWCPYIFVQVLNV